MKKSFVIKLISITLSVLMLVSVSAAGAGAVVVEQNKIGTGLEENVSPAKAKNNRQALPLKYVSPYVTAVRSQQYEDCWANAAIEAFESKLLHSNMLFDGLLSVNHLNAWSTKHSDGTGWQRNVYDSAVSGTELGYFASWYGGVEEKFVPKLTLDENTRGEMISPGLAKYGATAIKYMHKNNPGEVKLAIMNNGGVSASFSLVYSYFSDDDKSYYLPPSYDGYIYGHVVELVGWDDNYSRLNFGTENEDRPKKNGAWLARNSWGESSHGNGYFWISYEDKDLLNDALYGYSYTFENIIPITDEIKLLQNEFYGATWEFDYQRSKDVGYINKFEFTDDYTTIDKVIFESTSVGADYSLYFVPIENNQPSKDEGEWSLLYKGTVDYAGYICADIDDFDVSEGSGAIALKFDNEKLNENNNDDYIVGSVGIDEWVAFEDGEYAFINPSKKGDSFISFDGEIMDLLDYYKKNMDDDLGATFVIKAVAVKNDNKPELKFDVNQNGSVDIDDATLVQKYAAGICGLGETQLLIADANKDGSVDVQDATYIQKLIAEII